MKSASVTSARMPWRGLAAKKLNLEMLIERRARAKERRLVPESIARFIREAADFVPLKLKIIGNLPHTFEPGRTPIVLRRYEREADWKLPELANHYPRCSTDREAADEHKLEWVTPGHPLFEAIRRHIRARAMEPFGQGACFHSLSHHEPARFDFYRARVVDGLGGIVRENLFVVEIREGSKPELMDELGPVWQNRRKLYGLLSRLGHPRPLSMYLMATVSADGTFYILGPAYDEQELRRAFHALLLVLVEGPLPLMGLFMEQHDPRWQSRAEPTVSAVADLLARLLSKNSITVT